MNFSGLDFLHNDENTKLDNSDLELLEKNKNNIDYNIVFRDVKKLVLEKRTIGFNEEEIALIKFFCNKIYGTNYRLTENKLDDKYIEYLHFYEIGNINLPLNTSENIEKIIQNNDLKEICNYIGNGENLSNFSPNFKDLILSYISKKFNINKNELKDDNSLDKYLKYSEIGFNTGVVYEIDIDNKMVPYELISPNFPTVFLNEESKSGYFTVRMKEPFGIFKKIVEYNFFYQVILYGEEKRPVLKIQRADTNELKAIELDITQDNAEFIFEIDANKSNKKIERKTRNKIILNFKVK